MVQVCKIESCQRPLPAYDSHNTCIVCLHHGHRMYQCSICRDFPDDLFEMRMEALQYKKDNPVENPEEWEEKFFEKFPLLAPVMGVDDILKHQDESSMKQEEEKEDTQAAFHSAVRRLHQTQAHSTLSLPSELGPTRKRTAPETGSQASKKSRRSDSPDLEILEVSKPISPIPEKKSMDDRVATLEKLMVNVAKDISAIASRTPSAALGRNPEKESDEESELEMVPQKLSKAERRELWLNHLREINPELKHHQVDAPPASAHFGSFKSKEDKTVMPFCPLLQDEMKKASEARKDKKSQKKDPFKVVEKYYKTMEPVESTILQARSIPMELLGEIPPGKLQNAGASGAEARLKVDTPSGQKEVAALRDARQASSYIRLINSQELAITALDKLAKVQSEGIDDLLSENLPIGISTSMTSLKANVETIMAAVKDLQQGNGHLATCAIRQYTDATRDRQEAWLKSSSLPAPLQAEIARTELALPEGDSTQPLSILGKQAREMVTGHVQLRKDDVFREWYKAKSVTSGAARRFQQKKKPQKQELSYEAQSAGWHSQQYNPRGRGRAGRGARGRGGRGGKHQPFSKTESRSDNQ